MKITSGGNAARGILCAVSASSLRPLRGTTRAVKAILIGAGRGSRLRHLTEEIPKTLMPVLGRPMLDGVLEALAAGGVQRSDVVFICGYRY